MRNIIRFNTLATKGFKGVVLKPRGTQTQMYGNIIASSGKVFAIWDGATIDGTDLAYCNYNFYNASPTFQVA